MAKKGKRKAAPGDVATNRQASHRFELLDKMERGIVLQGTEVKSLRTGNAQLKDGYAAIRDGELWLHNVHIPPYRPANRDNHDPDRPRKLLAHRHEIAPNQCRDAVVETRRRHPTVARASTRPGSASMTISLRIEAMVRGSRARAGRSWTLMRACTL